MQSLQSYRVRVGALLFALVSPLLAASTASAQPCFRVGPSAGPVDDREVQLMVGVGDQVTVDRSCQFAPEPEGPWAVLPATTSGEALDFLSIYAALHETSADTSAARAAGGDVRPRFVYARRPQTRRNGSPLRGPQVLALRFCSHYLMEEELAFRLRAGDDLVIDRVPAGECGGAAVELRAVEIAAGTVRPMILRGNADHALAPADAALRLPHGEWAFYVARPGTSVGLRVGQLSSRVAHTPLRDYFAAARASEGSSFAVPALFAGSWDEQGGALSLRPGTGEGLNPVLWSELRTAAAAEQLWLARGDASAGPPVVVEGLHVRGADPAVLLPDELVGSLMQERFGEAGATMVPTRSDWKNVLADLSVCVSRSYREPAHAERGAHVPADAHCAPLAKIAQLGAALGAGTAAAEVCIARHVQIVTDGEAERVATKELCMPLDGVEDGGRLPFAVRGDALTLRGAPMDRVCLLLDNQPLEGTGDTITLAGAGLLEIRAAGGQGAARCSSRQGLSLLRIAVLDPEREWHPVGLVTGAPEPSATPWRTLPRDEPSVFAYTSSRQDLDFRVSSSAGIGAAVDGARGANVMSQHVPIIGGVQGELGGARPPALVAYVSRNATCPERKLADLRREVPLDVDALPVEARFHVFLAADRGADAPIDCLARASFRVRGSRVFASIALSPFLRLESGVLGDVRGILFMTNDAGAGVAVPLIYLRLSLFDWLGFDFSASGIVASTFNRLSVTRSGIGLSAAIDFGIPVYAPRLLSFGIMVHAPTRNTARDPAASLFLGLNLSTLVDLAGGR